MTPDHEDQLQRIINVIFDVMAFLITSLAKDSYYTKERNGCLENGFLIFLVVYQMIGFEVDEVGW